MKSKRFIAPALSFCLPGLGQLYQGRAFEGVAIFAVFTALNLSGGAIRFVVPIFAIVAAYEAYRRQFAPDYEPVVRANPAARDFAFLASGAFGFMLWFALVSPAFFNNVGHQVQINETVDALAAKLRACRKRGGSYPMRIEECTKSENDPWGAPYVYSRYKEGFELRSAGRDGKLGSADDFIYRFR